MREREGVQMRERGVHVGEREGCGRERGVHVGER